MNFRAFGASFASSASCLPCCESDLRGFVCHSVCSQISSNICPSRATRVSPSSFVVVVPRVARRASRARAHHFKSALHVELSGASSRALAPSFDISRRVAQCRPRCPEPCFAHRASRARRAARRARARDRARDVRRTGEVVRGRIRAESAHGGAAGSERATHRHRHGRRERRAGARVLGVGAGDGLEGDGGAARGGLRRRERAAGG